MFPLLCSFFFTDSEEAIILFKAMEASCCTVVSRHMIQEPQPHSTRMLCDFEMDARIMRHTLLHHLYKMTFCGFLMANQRASRGHLILIRGTAHEEAINQEKEE